MKAISKIFFGAGALLAAAGFSACTGDLDLLPTDPRSLTAADFEKDPQNYMEQVMADVYLNYSSVGPNMNRRFRRRYVLLLACGHTARVLRLR